MVETTFPGGPTAVERPAPSGSGSKPPLSVIHARALYEPVPPVEYDEDGYPYSDSHLEMEAPHSRAGASHSLCADSASGPTTPTSHETTACGRDAPVRVCSMRGDFHSRPLHAVLDALRAVFDGQDDMYFASDMGLFFEKGNRRAVVVPDLVVVFGAARRSRNSLKLWEEPKAPDFVMEIISEDSLRNDMEYKPPLYAALGVTEYWTFDSLGRLPTPIVARRLDDAGSYEPIPMAPDGSYPSDVLGFDLWVDASGLAVRDAATGESVFDPGTLTRLRRAAQVRAEQAESRAYNAETRANTAEARAEAARARANAAEARVAELEELLRQSRRR